MKLKDQKEITQEQIEAWKKEHGEVKKLTVGDAVAYLKKPNRQTMSAATVVGQNDPMKFNEILLKNCWLGGDKRIQDEDDYFLGASAVLAELVTFKAAELKNA